MVWRRVCSGVFLGMALAGWLSGEAWSQTQIGLTARANGSVSGQIGNRKTTIIEGSNVFQNQVIATAADADALLNFRDSTHLEVGPSSRVTLDRYVFNPDGGAKAAVMSLTAGSFRFVTGISEPRNIRLQTPQATIGIRGTIVEIAVENGVTRLQVVRGAVVLCLRSNPASCTGLVNQGGAVQATATDIDVTAAVAPFGSIDQDRAAREGNGGPSDNGGGPAAAGGESGNSASAGGNSSAGGSSTSGGASTSGGTGSPGRP